jgi:hypothetical protein
MTFLGVAIKTILQDDGGCRLEPQGTAFTAKMLPNALSIPARPPDYPPICSIFTPLGQFGIFLGLSRSTNILFIMKSIVGLALLTFSLVLVSFRPLSTYTLDDITTAIRVGNAGELSRYLDSRVDISLPDKSDTYSKIQAEMIIRDFFTTNGVQNFLVKHTGPRGAGSEFCVGVLQTRNGDYRTTLFIKQKGDKQFLQELRFQTQ